MISFNGLKETIQPIKKDGPKDALEYMTPTEIQQNLTDELSVFGAYKNPTEGKSRLHVLDNPKVRMDRIVYHGENILI